MLKYFVPSDTVIRVFSHIKAGTSFIMDITVISRFFYERSQEDRYRQVLSKLRFDPSQQYPVSETINTAIDRMIFAGWFIYPTANTNSVEISKKLKKDTEYLTVFFSKEEDACVKELSQLLLEKIKNKRRCKDA